MSVQFALDFRAERIQFNLSRDIGVRESGTAESAERIHEVKRSWQDCFGNGQLHIVHADTGELIGRKDFSCQSRSPLYCTTAASNAAWAMVRLEVAAMTMRR